MGLLSDIITSMIESKIENPTPVRVKQNNGSGRQNLLGTPSCKVAKTGCTIGCEMLNHCTQRGKYNVGD